MHGAFVPAVLLVALLCASAVSASPSAEPQSPPNDGGAIHAVPAPPPQPEPTAPPLPSTSGETARPGARATISEEPNAESGTQVVERGVSLSDRASTAFDRSRMLLTFTAGPVGSIAGAFILGGAGLLLDTAFRSGGPATALGAVTGALAGGILSVYAAGGALEGRGTLAGTIVGGLAGFFVGATTVIGLAALGPFRSLPGGMRSVAEVVPSLYALAMPFLGMVLGYESSHLVATTDEARAKVVPTLLLTPRGSAGLGVAGSF